MSAAVAALLAALRDRGIELAAEGDRLKVVAPRGALTPELGRALAEHRAALLEGLAAAQGDAGPRKVPGRPDPPWADPRPDLVEDRARWALLLHRAYELDGADPCGLFGALCGLRCCGARLKTVRPAEGDLTPEGPVPAWSLAPGKETEPADWELGWRYIAPHEAKLRRLLDGSGPGPPEEPGAAPA